MIDLKKFIEMIKGANRVLIVERDYIDDLNVFPVPDGDTGSNMNATVQGATLSIENKSIKSFSEFASIFSKALLMNARGNSGVILSQIMRGFLSNFTEDVNFLSPDLLKKSFLLAKEKAYQSVINPVEGTILTVIRKIAEFVNTKNYSNEKELFADVVSAGQAALDETPNLLPELKEVGVVDSGGYGLLSFFKGMNAALENKIDEFITSIKAELTIKKGETPYIDEENFNFFDQHKNEEGFGYCSEAIINLNLRIDPTNKNELKESFNIENFKNELLMIGNSLVCVEYDNLVKVHIHTMKPSRFLQIAQKYGEFEKIKIENMTIQYEEKINDSLNTQQVLSDEELMDSDEQTPLSDGLSIVVTAPTTKIADFIKEDFNVEQVLVTEEGVVPSTLDFIKAIKKCERKSCLVIIDDTNLFLAAEQAKRNISNIEVEIIPGKNLFEAIYSVSMVDRNQNIKYNYRELSKNLKKVLSAVISTSVKDVNYSHIKVQKNNKIGIINKKIVVSVQDEFAALKLTLDKLIMNCKTADICYLVYGMNANINVVKEFERYCSEKYGIYCEARSGGQKTYEYYIGIE
ncbi:DAK2 domain-containing protein [bacterium]|nr:DAK2 domain-containing protein [bacterium]